MGHRDSRAGGPLLCSAERRGDRQVEQGLLCLTGEKAEGPRGCLTVQGRVNGLPRSAEGEGAWSCGSSVQEHTQSDGAKEGIGMAASHCGSDSANMGLGYHCAPLFATKQSGCPIQTQAGGYS
eukprot:1155994-Pelagomonas_calceolata.AAC.2